MDYFQNRAQNDRPRNSQADDVKVYCETKRLLEPGKQEWPLLNQVMQAP